MKGQDLFKLQMDFNGEPFNFWGKYYYLKTFNILNHLR